MSSSCALAWRSSILNPPSAHTGWRRRIKRIQSHCCTGRRSSHVIEIHHDRGTGDVTAKELQSSFTRGHAPQMGKHVVLLGRDGRNHKSAADDENTGQLDPRTQTGRPAVAVEGSGRAEVYCHHTDLVCALVLGSNVQISQTRAG